MYISKPKSIEKISLLLCFFLLMFSVFFIGTKTLAQNSVEITLMRDSESITIYLEGNRVISLDGFTLAVETVDRQTITRRLVDYPAFAGLDLGNIQTPVCLRLESAAAQAPVPVECQTLGATRIFTQVLPISGVFWFDIPNRQPRSLLVLSYGELQAQCPAQQIMCNFIYEPPSETAIDLSEVNTVPDPDGLDETVDILANPATNSEIVSQVLDNDQLIIVGRLEGSQWYLVRTPDGMFGWTRRDLAPTGYIAQLTIEPITGYIFVRVPEGQFENEYGEASASFEIGLFEVTNQQYTIFMHGRGNYGNTSVGGQTRLDESSYIFLADGVWQLTEGSEALPVVNVTWYGAHDFCDWIGSRLPSAAEWTKTAMWNPVTAGVSELQTDGANINFQEEAMLPVGSRVAARTSTGVFDMIGNVWEWTISERGNYILRLGGAWDTAIPVEGFDIERLSSADSSASNRGFRCVR